MLNIVAMVSDLCEKANIEMPEVVVRNMGMIGGEFDPNTYTVSFNSQGLAFDDFWTTVVHEVAHAVDWKRNGDRRRNGKCIHHDETFYRICRELGDSEPTRTHSYPFKPTRKYREFEYLCGCPEPHIVKTPTHNKLQKGLTYICRGCKMNFGKEHFLKERK